MQPATTRSLTFGQREGVPEPSTHGDHFFAGQGAVHEPRIRNGPVGGQRKEGTRHKELRNSVPSKRDNELLRDDEKLVRVTAPSLRALQASPALRVHVTHGHGAEVARSAPLRR